MEISEFTQVMADKYRTAKTNWFEMDLDTASHEEFDAARRACRAAADELALSVLDDIDRAKARS